MRGEKKELFHFHSMAMVVSAVPATEEDSTRRAAPTSFIPWMPPWVALPLPDAGSSRLYRGRQPVLRLRAIASPLRTEQPNDQRTAEESQKERRKEREGKKVFQKIPRRKKAAGVAEANPPPLPRKRRGKERVLHFLTFYPTVLTLQTLVSKRRSKYCWLSKWQFRQLASGA